MRAGWAAASASTACAQRTLQLKLRYADFSTITRAHSLGRGTDLDPEMFDEIRRLFRANWKPGAKVRLLGCMPRRGPGRRQLQLEGEERREKWQGALAAADKLRDRFGNRPSPWPEPGARFRERVHETAPDALGRKP